MSSELLARGPVAYQNWRAADAGAKSLGAREFPIFTDAWIIGEITDLGPYRFFNTVPAHDRGDLAASIVARYDVHMEFEPDRDVSKTDDTSYHGGTLTDELSALLALSLGIRAKAGGAFTRRFDPGGEPEGRPIEWRFQPNPVLLKQRWGKILPEATEDHNLTEARLIRHLEELTPTDAMAVVRSARLYQDGLWIAESDPALAWLLLISAVESAAGHHFSGNDLPPLELLRIARPALFELLEARIEQSVREEIATDVAHLFRSTRKFIDFCLTFLAEAPTRRPAEWGQHPWNVRDLKASLLLIYRYRSRALHGGTPFPAPMCEPPFRHQEWQVPAERHFAESVQSKGGKWIKKDIPMHLHTFEYIVRSALQAWWRQLPAQSGA